MTMNSVLRKIWQRSLDPVFYRKQFCVLRRRFVRQGEDLSDNAGWECFGPLGTAKVVVAHPDDETFCSGAIAYLVDQGVSVEVLCLTRGEGGPTGGESRESLGARREEEMRNACDSLGVTVRFLDHVDPTANGHRVYAPRISPADLAAQLSGLICDVDLVLSHGSNGEYWHPGHLLVHDSIDRIHRGRGLAGNWLTFLARDSRHSLPRLVNWDDPPFFRFDSKSYSEVRERALSCHVSQLGLFRRFAGGEISDFVEKTSIESYALKKAPVIRDPESD